MFFLPSSLIRFLLTVLPTSFLLYFVLPFFFQIIHFFLCLYVFIPITIIIIIIIIITIIFITVANIHLDGLYPSHSNIFNISVKVICKNTDLTVLHKTDFSDNPQSETIMRPRKEVLWTDFLHICREPLHFPLHCTGPYHRSSNSGLQRLLLLTDFAKSSVQTRCLGIQKNCYRNLRVVCWDGFF